MFRPVRGLRPSQTRRHLARLLGVAVAFGALGVTIAPASALTLIRNHLDGAVESVDGPRLHDYAQPAWAGVVGGPPGAQPWTTGAAVNTTVTPATIELSRYGDTAPSAPPWWDVNWRTRRCYTIDNSAAGAVALTEYQVQIDLDTAAELGLGWMLAGGADIRAVGADGTTTFPFWIEGPVPSTTTSIWVRVDSIPVGSTSFCLYWNHPTAAPASDELATFSYTTPTPIYWAVSDRYTGAGNGGRLDVVSFADGNQISVDGGPTTTLDTGAIASLTGVNDDSVVSVTAPLAGRGVQDGQESLVPISFAGTTFVIPTNRGTQQFSLAAPFASSNVTIHNGDPGTPGTAIWSGTVPAGTSITVQADLPGNRSAVIVASEPVLATHQARQGYDSVVAPPWTGADLFGVRSRGAYVGFSTNGSMASVLMSDGWSATISGNGGSFTNLYDATDLDGNGTAVRITGMTGPTGAVQQADRDGWESSSFLPEDLLSATYWIPVTANYVALACPTPGTTIEVSGSGGTSTVACDVEAGVTLAGAPGHGHVGNNNGGSLGAGTRVRSLGGQDFYAYYEDNRRQDETSLFGAKVARQRARVEPTNTAGAREGLYFTDPDVGTWSSPVLDTGASGVFGLLGFDADLPVGTSVAVRVASGATPAAAAAAPLLGPDGTTGTAYVAAPDQPVAFAHDGDQHVRFGVTLRTTDPLVTPLLRSVSITGNLAEIGSGLGPSLIERTSPPGVATSSWLIRIVAPEASSLDGSSAVVEVTNPTAPVGLTAAELRLGGLRQALVSGPTITQPVDGPATWGFADPLNLAIDSTLASGPVDLDLVWRISAPSGVIVEHDVTLRLNP